MASAGQAYRMDSLSRFARESAPSPARTSRSSRRPGNGSPSYRADGSAARAVRSAGSAARSSAGAARRADSGTRRRDLRVERTGDRGERQSSLLVTAGVMAAILLLVVAALAFGRITLMNATVTTMIESDALSTQIETMRSEGISLEMEQSVLSNTHAVNAAAKRLGMVAPYEVEHIALSPDVVVLNDEGGLSLSASLKTLAENQG